MIVLENVTFSWPSRERVLAISHFEIAAGERVFLQGPSGSGKSTLLGVVGGVLVPQSGQVRVLDTDLTRLRASQRDRFRGDHIGFIFQMFNLVPYLSVRENVLLPLRFSEGRSRFLQGVGAVDEALRLLSALGLSDSGILSRPVTELSMGQQQRVAAARALIGRPQILIADEPTSSLDSDVRTEFLRLLMDECATYSTTLLFVSHDNTLRSMFDRTVHLQELNGATLRAA